MTHTRRPPPLGMGNEASAEPVAASLGSAQRWAMQRLRVAWRAGAIILFTVPAAAVQAVLLQLPGNGKRRFARFYWATLSRIMGIERRVIGRQLRNTGRPVLFVSNHTSWLDILTLGGTLSACFVAKAEVADWPVVSIVARLGRTVFVSRKARETGRERDDMRARMAAGDNLLLFPEGTSSDGARTLPFRSAFFSTAEARAGTVPIIQPVSIVYDRVEGLPVGRASRPISSWYGAMELGSHFWRLAAIDRLRATILLHPPVDPADYASRKELSRAVWEVVARGAAALRQNRRVTGSDVSVSLDSAAANTGTVDST